MWIIAAAVLGIACLMGGAALYGKKQMGKIPAMSFQEVLAYTTKDTPEAVITVGVIRGGKAKYQVYGENAKALEPQLHTYEIGSLTKTFTAALIGKAVQEGRIDPDSAIDRYLPLPKGRAYPTVRALLTHTSGYKEFYFESPMIDNFLKGRNDFCGVTKEMVLARAGRLNAGKHGFVYSNFGYAVLGLILEAEYEKRYAELLEDFVQGELGLTGTRISDQGGDLGHYWVWRDQDAYMPAGAVTSDMEDMLRYAQMQLEKHPRFADCHRAIEVIDASSAAYKTMDINMDEIGMSWIIDRKNGIVWHNGGTGHYNCYLGFDTKTQTAVVVLSNLAPNYRIPATVLGVKRLLEMRSESL